MPPSPALRCSPGRELKGETHKRGHSLEGVFLLKEKDDDLALFNEMQLRERESFLLQSNDDFEDSFSRKLNYFSDIKLGISVPVRGESSDLLNADGEKNDYDWLLTPPDTPLFPSLDDETPPLNLAQQGRPRSQPISISRSSTMEKRYKSSRGSASPHRSSTSPRSSNSVFPSSGRPSSAPHSSPNSILYNASTSRRPSPPPGKPSTPRPRSSTPTARRMSTGSNSIQLSGARGASPVKASSGNSASPKIKAWQANIPGFSSDAPPNLRTSLADRPASYVRGSSPASRYGRDPSSKFGRQSVSPTASRSISSSYSNDRDRLSSHSKGSVASSGDDDVDSLKSMPVGPSDGLASKRVGSYPKNRALAFSKKPSRSLTCSSAPKRSFDSSLRQMDHRKSPQNMFRPLLSSVPSTTFYVGKATSVQRALLSRNSSVTTSSNASSDQGTTFALDAEGSDQNHDDVVSACDNIASHEVQEELFLFDKADVVNENVLKETCDGRLQHGDFDGGGLAMQCGPVDSHDFDRHGTAMASSDNPQDLYVKADFLDAKNHGDVICSICGHRYDPVESVEVDAKLCPDCSKEDGVLNINIPVATSIYQNSANLGIHLLEENKQLSDAGALIVSSRSPEVTDTTEIEHKDTKTCFINQKDSDLQENSLAGPLAEEREDNLADQRETNKPSTGFCLSLTDAGVEKLENLNDHTSSEHVASVGTGISVLLNRSSRSKGNVVQGRTFTASSRPYEDLSYARHTTNGFRISSGHGEASATSSVDLSSSRQEGCAQRQLCCTKSDIEGSRIDMDSGLKSAASSFSGISSAAYQSSKVAKSCEEDSDVSISNVEFDNEESAIASEVRLPGSEDIEVENMSSTKATVLQENGNETNGRPAMNAWNSEASRHIQHVQSDENRAAFCPDNEDTASCENGEGISEQQGCILDGEAVVTSLNSSFLEERVSCSASLEGSRVAEVPTHSSLVRVSGIEIESCHQDSHGPEFGVVPPNLESNMDDVPSDSDRDLTASIPESSLVDPAHSIPEESTVMVGGKGVSKGRSLTLEEATDSILFCSSIVHDLACQAATIAIDKEVSIPIDGSRPTVTVMGKSTSDRKDLRSRACTKRSVRSQKPRQKWVETDMRALSSSTENDENVGESLAPNVGLPNKVDHTKPPKLESKCNCTVM